VPPIARLTDAIRGRAKAVIYAATAAAVIATGSAGAVIAFASPARAAVTAASAAPAGAMAGQHHASGPAPQAGRHRTTAADSKDPARRAASRQSTARQQAAGQRSDAAHARQSSGPPRKNAPQVTARRVAQAKHGPAHINLTRVSWHKAAPIVASKTDPGLRNHGGRGLPAADQLQPAGNSGPQEFMQITASRMANATTITAQALHKHMGIRSAVIAVATAMQESTLENISYGDSDSLGLFQQRPSMGWGSAAQVTNPAYAADAFLNSLAAYQHQDPAWATQPLWQAAQSVQNSGFPNAYAKWEAQAAQLVSIAARHLV
jgi:hypothetical protein